MLILEIENLQIGEQLGRPELDVALFVVDTLMSQTSLQESFS